MSNSSFQRATPFAYGAGHVQPNRAADPGLVYDIATDYLHFLCALGYNSTVIDTFMTGDDGPHARPTRPRKPEDLNYPSVTAPHLSASGEPHSITSKVRSVGAALAAYDVRVSEPRGVSMSVRPSRLKFTAAGEKEFAVTFRAREGRFLPGEYVFGQMVWSDGAGRCSHRVRSPVVVGLRSSTVLYGALVWMTYGAGSTRQ
uniref:Subtilisin-like protease fibronectin type-III domain-containing protein n=1 Tax=Hordeum vulgare subsp. vulgare TaxID=112509 RepID=A0A8I6XIM8_HORVV